jgi:hypothetical protein
MTTMAGWRVLTRSRGNDWLPVGTAQTLAGAADTALTTLERAAARSLARLRDEARRERDHQRRERREERRAARAGATRTPVGRKGCAGLANGESR